MKTCSKCGATKPVSEFSSHPRTRDRRRPECRACVSEYNAVVRARPGYAERQKDAVLRRNFGISLEEFIVLFNEQDGRCAVCAKPGEILGKRSTTLHVDHDHDTGQIRGLLCQDCNLGLGIFADSPDRLMAAAAYLLSEEKVTAVHRTDPSQSPC